MGGRNAVLRVFGPQPHFFDRRREHAICEALRRQSFGAEVLGVFGNGRIESLLSGRALELKQGSRKPEMGLPEFFPAVARRIGQFHRCEISFLKGSSATEAWAPWLALMDEAAKSRPSEEEKAGRYDALGVPALAKELRTLVDELIKRSRGSPLVPTHHDLNWGNIMVTEGEGMDVQIIDYEYVAYNFQAVDIATHFQWYLGTGPEFFMEDFPSEDQQRSFIAEYLRAYKGTDIKDESVEVESMYQEVRRWSLATWLSVGAWMIVKA